MIRWLILAGFLGDRAEPIHKIFRFNAECLDYCVVQSDKCQMSKFNIWQYAQGLLQNWGKLPMFLATKRPDLLIRGHTAF